MTITLAPRVLELIASRLCHDLVSPVGAVNNGVELMEDLGPDAGQEALHLISNSAQQAAAKLKCFRLCYGAAGTDKNINWNDVRDVFSDWIKATPRIKLEWDPAVALKMPQPPRGFLKVLLNLLILAEECTHGDGTVMVAAYDQKPGVRISVKGDHAGFRDGAITALEGQTDIEDLDPRSIHAYVTGVFARHFGMTLGHQATPDQGQLDLILTA